MSQSSSKKKQFGFMFAGLGLGLLALMFENVNEVVAWSLIIFGAILSWIGWNAFIDERRQK
jgi:predicted tellurium resistance membrane protein TerC